jgi:hypothetical protein
VMDRESVPDFRGHFGSIDIGQRLPPMLPASPSNAVF